MLDRHGSRLPVGVPGELVHRRRRLAAGYLNRPELTAENFIAEPVLAAIPSTRLYRTGDLVRWLAGREPGVSGPAGPSGEDPRLPH